MPIAVHRLHVKRARESDAGERELLSAQLLACSGAAAVATSVAVAAAATSPAGSGCGEYAAGVVVVVCLCCKYNTLPYLLLASLSLRTSLLPLLLLLWRFPCCCCVVSFPLNLFFCLLADM